jgi:putative Mg2+ transporter-C (MgtC) family protein
MPSWEMVLRLLLAAGLGSMIGLERERLAWTAGLRTHMLVSVGACLMILVSAYGFTATLGPHVVLDPSRVAAQVVSGIGFLGAGSIILRNEVVKGLTTAASLWAVAGIGRAAGAGLYVAAIATTLIILAILVGLKPLEARYHASRRALTLHLRVAAGQMSVGLLERVLGRRAAQVKQLLVRSGAEAGLDEVVLVMNRVSDRDTIALIAALAAAESISDVSEASPSEA